MFGPTRLMAAACAVFLGGVALGAAQKPPVKGVAKTPPPKVLTTSSGVYTPAQAAKGERVYMTACVSCHPPGTYAAQAFRDKWNGAPLSQLFDFVADTMPKNEPGSLETQDYIQVISYILKINGAPPGKTPLAADSRELKKIRLYLPRR
jgi:S-disulfanyl-L-cysteine oxidoreductase SoxD